MCKKIVQVCTSGAAGSDCRSRWTEGWLRCDAYRRGDMCVGGGSDIVEDAICEYCPMDTSTSVTNSQVITDPSRPLSFADPPRRDQAAAAEASSWIHEGDPRGRAAISAWTDTTTRQASAHSGTSWMQLEIDELENSVRNRRRRGAALAEDRRRLDDLRRQLGEAQGVSRQHSQEAARNRPPPSYPPQAGLSRRSSGRSSREHRSTSRQPSRSRDSPARPAPAPAPAREPSRRERVGRRVREEENRQRQARQDDSRKHQNSGDRHGRH